MVSHITPEQMEIYKRTARERMQAEKVQCVERRERAWTLARKAADLLRKEFGVSRVLVFGSLVHEDRFTLFSDVDIAAWGLTPANWLGAMSAVHGLSGDLELNLVDVTVCSLDLLAVIEKEGKPL